MKAMIYNFSDLDSFKKSLAKNKISKDADSILRLDLPFYDYQDKVSVMYFPVYQEKGGKFLVMIYKKDIFVLNSIGQNNQKKKYKNIIGKSHGESTVAIFLMLKSILKNYSEQFQKIRNTMNELDIHPVLEQVEISGRELRRLTDRMESLVELIIVLKQREVKQFDTNLVDFDYDILTAEARYWLERCRSHIYRVASLRTKSEMQSNRELNKTMQRLTVIMTFLTIVGIVVNVPSSVGGVFGIPAFSDAYFKNNIPLMVWTLILSFVLSIVLGWIYWKSLGLKYS